MENLDIQGEQDLPGQLGCKGQLDKMDQMEQLVKQEQLVVLEGQGVLVELARLVTLVLRVLRVVRVGRVVQEGLVQLEGQDLQVQLDQQVAQVLQGEQEVLDQLAALGAQREVSRRDHRLGFGERPGAVGDQPLARQVMGGRAHTISAARSSRRRLKARRARDFTVPRATP